MKKLSRIAATIITLVMIFSLTGCKLITKTEQGEYNTVVAKANGKNIVKGEYNKALAIRKVLLGAYYGYDFFDGDTGASYLSTIKSDVLDQVVLEQVVEDKAKALGLINDEDAINEEAKKQMDTYMDALSNKDGFNDALEKNGITNDDLLASFRSNVIYQKLYDETTKDVTVTDDDAKKYYDENPYEFTEQENVMNLSHILVATLEDALSVQKRLKNGEKFEDVAKEVSTDTGTAAEGGLLGDVNYVGSNYVQEFVDAAIKLKAGEISEPVQTQYGWHIIKCNSKSEYPVKAFDVVKEDIKKDRLSDKKQEAFDSAYDTWKKAAKAKTYSDRI
jgi:foldase protein PrsA